MSHVPRGFDLIFNHDFANSSFEPRNAQRWDRLHLVDTDLYILGAGSPSGSVEIVSLRKNHIRRLGRDAEVLDFGIYLYYYFAYTLPPESLKTGVLFATDL